MTTDEPRYAFGRNWALFSERLPAQALEHARRGLQAHVGDLQGCSFLDAGSGSGLMSVAALSLGASRVLAFDYDEESVTTSERLLEHFDPDGNWEVRRGDVLTDSFGRWDVVYSWGVLHHTGDVRTALRRATEWVDVGGRLVVGIYQRTPTCAWWTKEKRWYSQAGAFSKALARWLYSAALIAVWALKRQNPIRVLREKSTQRGMSFWTDVDDWLGGYPYESMTLDEIVSIVEPLGFSVEAAFPLRLNRGLLGSGNQTLRFRRITVSELT